MYNCSFAVVFYGCVGIGSAFMAQQFGGTVLQVCAKKQKNNTIPKESKKFILQNTILVLICLIFDELT